MTINAPKKNQIWLLNANPTADVPHPGTRVKVLRSVTDPNKERVFVEVLEDARGHTKGERFFEHVRDLITPEFYEEELAAHQVKLAAQVQSRTARALLWRSIRQSNVPRVLPTNNQEALILSLKADTPEELKESVTALVKVLQDFLI